MLKTADLGRVGTQFITLDKKIAGACLLLMLLFLVHIILGFLCLSEGSGQVLSTCTGGNKTLTPSTSPPVTGEIAGVNTASLGGCLHNSTTRARGAERFHDELNGHVFDLEREGGLRQVAHCP